MLDPDIEFKKTKEFERAAEILIKYAHCDLSAIDNKKAIGIIGPTGSRKTFIMNCLFNYIHYFQISYFLNDPEELIKFYGPKFISREIINEYVTNQKENIINKWVDPKIILIDDIGSEPMEAVKFGNRGNIIEGLFELRYSKGNLTHFTSNFNMPEIKKYYGDRISSRITQTTNIIELKDKDFRLC